MEDVKNMPYAMIIRGVAYQYYAFSSCMENWIVLRPIANCLYQQRNVKNPNNPCYDIFMGGFATYEEALDALKEKGYKHDKVKFAFLQTVED